MAKQFNPYDYVQQPDYANLESVSRYGIQTEMAGRIQRDLDDLNVLPPRPQVDASRLVETAQRVRISELEGELATLKEAWQVLRDLAEADEHD